MLSPNHHQSLKEYQNHVMDMWSSTWWMHGSDLGFSTCATDVVPLWTYSKNRPATTNHDGRRYFQLLPMTGAIKPVCTSSSSILLFFFFTSTLTSCFSALPQTSYMWQELHQTVKGFIFFPPKNPLAAQTHTQEPLRNPSFQFCRLQTPRQVWPAVSVKNVLLSFFKHSFHFVFVGFQVKRLTRTVSSESVVNSGKGLG